MLRGEGRSQSLVGSASVKTMGYLKINVTQHCVTSRIFRGTHQRDPSELTFSDRSHAKSLLNWPGSRGLRRTLIRLFSSDALL